MLKKAKKTIKFPSMKKLLDYIEYKEGISGGDVAKRINQTRQNYHRMKNSKSKILAQIVLIADEFNLSPTEIFEQLEHDYGNKK